MSRTQTLALRTKLRTERGMVEVWHNQAGSGLKNSPAQLTRLLQTPMPFFVLLWVSIGDGNRLMLILGATHGPVQGCSFLSSTESLMVSRIGWCISVKVLGRPMPQAV